MHFHPSGAPEITPSFWRGSCCLFFSFLCCVMCTIVCVFLFYIFSQGVVSLSVPLVSSVPPFQYIYSMMAIITIIPPSANFSPQCVQLSRTSLRFPHDLQTFFGESDIFWNKNSCSQWLNDKYNKKRILISYV